MIYEVIVRTEPEEIEFIHLSYEDLLRTIIDRLIFYDQVPITIRRRCCSSIHEQTISISTCNDMRRLAGITDDVQYNKENYIGDIAFKLDTALNNWYLRGKISLSRDGLISSPDVCDNDLRSSSDKSDE